MNGSNDSVMARPATRLPLVLFAMTTIGFSQMPAGAGLPLGYEAPPWITNLGGEVRCTLEIGSDLITGGQFTSLSTPMTRLLPTHDVTGEILDRFGSPGRRLPFGSLASFDLVQLIRPDASGGWWIGSRFDPTGGPGAATRLTRILPSGALDAGLGLSFVEVPGQGARVLDVAASGTTLYVAGLFQGANGATRTSLLAFDLATRQILAFDAQIGSVPGFFTPSVFDIELTGNTLWLAGEFTSVGGATRRGFAAVDATTGGLLPFDAALAASGTGLFGRRILPASAGVYVAGVFSSAGGLPRSNLALLDAATGAAAPGFDPSPDGEIIDLLLTGGDLYLGGAFAQVAGQARAGLAAVDPGSGVLRPWDPGLGGSGGVAPRIRSLAREGNTLYAGGNFTGAGAASRTGVAAWSLSTGQLEPYDPRLLSSPSWGFTEVFDVDVANGTAYLAGVFNSAAPIARSNLAAGNSRTGFPLTFAPSLDGPVEALERIGGSVFAGGSFTMVGSAPRSGLAAFAWPAGTLLPFDAQLDGPVRTLTECGGTLFVAGGFGNAGGQPRAGLAALDPTSGLATTFDPAPNGSVLDLANIEGLLYVGGDFTTIAGQPRSGVAVFDPATGQLLPFAPTVNGAVRAVAGDADGILIGGSFNMVEGQQRSGLAELLPNGALTPFAPQFANVPFSPPRIDEIVVRGRLVHVVGSFERVALVPIANAAQLRRDMPNGGARPLAVSDGPHVHVNSIGDRVLLGGPFNPTLPPTVARGVTMRSLFLTAGVGAAELPCSNQVSAPRLDATLPVLDGFHLYDLAGAMPNQTGTLFISLAPSPWEQIPPLPGGCPLALDLDSLAVLSPIAADQAGVWQLPIPLPGSLAALVLDVPLRATAVLDAPGGPLLNAFELTNTLEVTIGY